MTAKNDGHRARLRQRYLKAGCEGFHDYELLELLLTYAIPRRDVKDRAKALIAEFEGVAGVLNATPEELARVDGVSEASIVLIKLIRDVFTRCLSETLGEIDVVASPEAVWRFSRIKLGGMRREVFMVLYLNTKNHVLNHEIVSNGTIDQAHVYPREIVKNALSTDANAVILVHNHPSGVCDPSNDDIKLTSMVKDAVEAVGILLLDHIVVSDFSHFSFIENGLI